MEYYDFILEVIQKAGQLLREEQVKGFTVSSKEGNERNVVTNSDLIINKFLEGEIIRVYPEHRIYSEESVAREVESEYQWTLDPIDGTSNFARGIPHYAVCVGLLRLGVPIAGAVFNPITNELFSFKLGEGAFLNGAPLHVSTITQPEKGEVLFSGGGRDKSKWEWGVSVYRTLLTSVGKRRLLGCSSLDVCFVAAGRVEACVYGTLTTLDISPAFGILKEAGGIARTDEGKELTLTSLPQQTYVANNEAFYAALRELLVGN
jgi:myo-inositol-1(or 4)-monophosphatase